MNYLKGLFEGRVSARHFTRGTLLLIILAMASIYLIDLFLPFVDLSDTNSTFSVIIGWIILGFFILLFISLLVRRLHDLGHSGLLALLFFIPILWIQWFFEDGKSENQYGAAVPRDTSLISAVFNIKAKFVTE